MRILRLTLSLAALAALISLAAPASAAINSVTIPMKALNHSGETGTATLTQMGSGVLVVVKLKGAPKTAQPTHIHIGTCGHINAAPEFPLVSTVNGKSTTTVSGVTLAQLLKSPYAINVHKSTSDLGTYVACGNITAGSK